MGDNRPFNTNVVSSTYKVLICIACILLFAVIPAFSQGTLLDKQITIPRQNTTLYNALNLLSEKAGCLFVYDSQTVENEKHVRLFADNQPLKVVLDNLLANPELGYRILGEHILIYKQLKTKPIPTATSVEKVVNDSIQNIVISGFVFDKENNLPIPYATIGIVEENIGTVTNTDGFFSLKISSQFSGASLVVSHMGFMSRLIPVQLLDKQKVDIFLERRVISIQEVIIRYIDPEEIIDRAMEKRVENNSRVPVYFTSFYREGVQKNDRFISYSEAVFKVYKSPYTVNESNDQVKILKSRKIQNSNPQDTVFLKLKAGVLSALQLDIVKCIPGFLDQLPPLEYDYTYSDLVSYNAKDAFAITFVQKPGIKRALFTGTLYVEKENFAILGADFQVNPAFLDVAAADLVLKKSRKLIVKFDEIKYSVSYKPFNDKLYLNHVRCDIKLKTRLRHHLVSDNFSTFLEFAVCKIDSADVQRFTKQEVIRPNAIFTDAPYPNDNSFWGDYNIISPEANLSEALSKIIGKIEEIK